MFMKTIKAALVAALFAGGVAPSYALDVDQNRLVPARDFNTQTVHYYRLTINATDPRVGTAQLFGALPKNAYILAIDADVTTAFTGGTTPAVTLGVTKASANEIVAGTGTGASITIGTAGVQHLTSAAGLGVAVTGNVANQNTFGDVPLYALVSGGPTAGSVTIVIQYALDNDM